MLGWEILNGVGVDGVGGIFPPFFFRFSLLFFVFLRSSSLFFAFLRFSLQFFQFFFFFVFLCFYLRQGQTTAIYCKNFTPTWSTPTPGKTSRLGPFPNFLQRRALYGPMPVKTRTFREILEPLVHMNCRGNSQGPMAPLPFFQGNSYGPMVLKVRPKFPPRLALVHGWLFPIFRTCGTLVACFAAALR